MSKTYPLTGWDCLQLLTKGFSDQQVRMVVEFEGRLDEERLAQAVRAAVQAEPILACRVQRRFFHPRWKRLRDFDAGRLLQVVPAADPETAVRQLLIEDLDPWRGPIVQFGLVRSEHDTLVVNLDHTAGDAASVRSLAYLLATLYGRPERLVPAEPGLYFGKRGFQTLLRDLPAADRLRRPAPPGGGRPSWQFPWRPDTVEFRKRILLRRLTPGQAEALRLFAAGQHVWLNDIFLAVYFRALARLIGQGTASPRLTIPVDMRKYLPVPARPRIANFSASFEMEMGSGIGGSLEKTLGFVGEAMKKEKEGRPGLGMAAALTALADKIPYRIVENRVARGKIPGSLPPPWFIALGVLRPECLSFGPVAARYAYSLPSVTRAGGVFQLSASLFERSMTLGVCFAGDEANVAVVNRFLDLYQSELPT